MDIFYIVGEMQSTVGFIQSLIEKLRKYLPTLTLCICKRKPLSLWEDAVRYVTTWVWSYIKEEYADIQFFQYIAMKLVQFATYIFFLPIVLFENEIERSMFWHTNSFLWNKFIIYANWLSLSNTL